MDYTKYLIYTKRKKKKGTEKKKKIKEVKNYSHWSTKIRISKGGIKNGYLRRIPLDFFPKDAIGSRHKFIKEGKHITIFLDGVNYSFTSDIAGEGRNRIRRSGNVFKDFYKFFSIKEHDLIVITRTGKRSYKISPYSNVTKSNLKINRSSNMNEQAMPNEAVDATHLIKTEIESSIKAPNAMPSGQPQPQKSKKANDIFNRNNAVKDYVLNLAEGVCECCKGTAPFCKDDGSPFLEIHHIHFLSEGGADTIENTVAVCPNCHKELHWGKKRHELKNKLYKNYKRLKKST